MAAAPTLTVLSGPLRGRSFTLDLASGEATVGSDGSCDVQLEDASVAPRHALFQTSGAEILVQAAEASAEVEINGQPIPWLTPVNHGDRVTLGGIQLEYAIGEAQPELPIEVDEEEVPFSWPPTDAAEDGSESPVSAAAQPIEPDAPVPAPEPPTPVAPAPEVTTPAPPAPQPAATEDEGPSFDFGSSGGDEAPARLDLGGPEPEPEPAAEPPAPAAEEPAPIKLKAPLPEAEAVPEPVAPAPRAPRVTARVPRKTTATAGRPGRRHRLPIARYLIIALIALAVLGGGGYLLAPLFLPPELQAVAPARVSIGQTVVLSGRMFGSGPEDNAVLFGEVPGRVVMASRDQLQVEVPQLPLGAGADVQVSVRVRVGDRTSKPQILAVFQPPTISSLSPEVAMPGEVIAIGGFGWESQAEVRFGGTEAEVVEARPSQIRVRVPRLQDVASQVTVMVAGLSSAPVPFLVGKLPLITGVEPPNASPGDRVVIRGKGFGSDPAAVAAQVAATPALVVAAAPEELTLIVPRVPAQEEPPPLEVRVPGSSNVGHGTLSVAPLPDPVGFRFVAEPFTLAGARSGELAVVSTALGPAFVLASSGGASAAQRALRAQERLNAAAPRLAQPGSAIAARGLDGEPSIGVVGASEPLIEVTAEDAAAYNQPWARPRGGAGPTVTPERLARWWGAVSNDLARLLARGEAPQDAAALAREGRALVDLHAASGSGAVTLRLVSSRPSLRRSLGTLGLRVPAGVPATRPPPAAVAAGADATPVPGTDEAGALSLTGTWRGWLREAGRRRTIGVTFDGDAGTLAYEGAVGFSQPISGVRHDGAQVSFIVTQGGGERYFRGGWDGRRISGAISSSAGGQGDIGVFELAPPRR